VQPIQDLDESTDGEKQTTGDPGRHPRTNGAIVAKPKRKLTAAERRAKKERKKKYQWIFINGKQVRVKRPPTIDGLPVDEFILRNADPIWLHQNGMWEYIQPEPIPFPDEDEVNAAFDAARQQDAIEEE
jgi:hypothetical protein